MTVDNLQESAIWAGTPLYFVKYSKDKTCSFVL
ncbi:SH3 domain-containing protein [Pigmentibacter ruber]